MTTKQQPKAASPEQDRRAAALRENLRKRKLQAEMREAQAARGSDDNKGM